MLNKKFVRLPDGTMIPCYSCVVDSLTCEVKFINKNAEEVKKFFGAEIIDYIDILDENKELIESYNIYRKRTSVIVGNEVIQKPIVRVVKEAYDETIPAVKEEETGKVLTEETTVHHEAVTETVYEDVKVEMTTAIFSHPSFDEELNNIKEVVGIVNPNKMSLEDFKKYYKGVIGDKCTEAIYGGADVTVAKGKKHFSYTDDDQKNINDLFVILVSVQENLSLPYHADGEYCEMYTGEDIVKIFATLSIHKMYHTTYCNILNRMIENAQSINAVKEITYGMEITAQEDKKLLDNITAQSKAIVNKVLTKFGVSNASI